MLLDSSVNTGCLSSFKRAAAKRTDSPTGRAYDPVTTPRNPSRLLKNSVAGCSKRSQRRGARISRMADSLWHIIGTIRYRPYAISQPGARRLSATKHMSLFQQLARTIFAAVFLLLLQAACSLPPAPVSVPAPAPERATQTGLP